MVAILTMPATGNSTTAHKISETNSSFQVKQRTMRKV